MEWWFFGNAISALVMASKGYVRLGGVVANDFLQWAMAYSIGKTLEWAK